MIIYFLKNKTIIQKDIADKIIAELIYLLQFNQGLDGVLILDEVRAKAGDNSYKFCNSEISRYLSNKGFLQEDGNLTEEVRNIAISGISVENQVPVFNDPIIEIYETDDFFNNIDVC